MNYEQLYEDKQNDYYYHSRDEMLAFVPESIHKVLDVGCGNGAFGDLLKKQYSCQVWGIEPHKPAALAAQKKLDKVINSLFVKDLVELAGQKFDVIFFNDVLEHLVMPNDALLLASTLLNKGGYIVASIPNIRFYPVMLSLIRYKDFKYLESGVMDKTHLRFFTEKSMIRLFNDNGYLVKRIEGINKHQFKYLEILNILLFNRLQDMRYPQYAIVAQINPDASANQY